MMTVRKLLAGIEVMSVKGPMDTRITGITQDSRKVEEGFCFVAISGYRDDGNRYILDAVGRGAKMVVSETLTDMDDPGVTRVRLSDIRKAFALISLNFYGNPLKDKYVVGVTGTNGKTTVVSLIDAIFGRTMRTVRFGTLGAWCGARGHSGSLTTPEANDLYRFIAGECRGDFQNVVMEVSSAALELKRVEGITFSQAVFTNFSGDHLDFHGDMDSYFDSKLSLFSSLEPGKWAVINIDDEKGPLIIEAIDSKYITYGFSEEADIRPLEFKLLPDGIQALVRTPSGDIGIESRLIGRVNLMNILAAVASAIVRNVPFEDITEALREFRAVKGRLDMVYRNEFSVLIDYAHTDNALENLLVSVRELNFNRIILVFGAGGSRDRSKRPRMGAVAAKSADMVIVTSDNPRDEDPEEIIRQIVGGFPPGFKAFRIEADREKAIGLGIGLAARGDIVIIAGKGHEDYQILGKKVIPFDDYQVVSKYTEVKRAGT